MIVVMAAGLAANLTANPFEAVTTVTVQIVTLLIGDQEFDSAKTLAAFALGLVHDECELLVSEFAVDRQQHAIRRLESETVNVLPPALQLLYSKLYPLHHILHDLALAHVFLTLD